MEIVIPLVVAVLAWLGNQYAQLIDRNIRQKQERYNNILTNIGGLAVGQLSPDKIETFITEARLLWLSAPDHVITRVENFIDTVALAKPDKEKEEALGEMIAAMRADTLSKWPLSFVRTKLRFSDFKFRGLGPAVAVQGYDQERIHAGTGSAEVEFLATLLAHQVILQQILKNNSLSVEDVAKGAQKEIAGYRVEVHGTRITENDIKKRILIKVSKILSI